MDYETMAVMATIVLGAAIVTLVLAVSAYLLARLAERDERLRREAEEERRRGRSGE